MPIAACGPVAAYQLLTALGASIEPLLFVIVLWMWRARPVPFGILLCVGALHREFTMFAMPAIALVEWWELRAIRWPTILKATIAFSVSWLAIDQLKRHINIAGPGVDARTGAGGSLVLEAVQVGRLLSFHPTVYLARLHLLLTQGLPDLFGARPSPLISYAIWGTHSVGSQFAGAALAAAIGLCAGGLLWTISKGRSHSAPFLVFLSLVSVQAIVAYGFHGGTNIEPLPELNYVLLVLFLPVALFGAYFCTRRTHAIAGSRFC
jgi:hypothetical protein